MIKIFVIVALLAVGGTIVWKNMPDEVVVTKNDIPSLMPDVGAIKRAQDVVDRAVEKVDGTVLDMSNQGLTKVSQDVFRQTDVTTLNLSNNNLSGSLPAEVRLLTKLRILDLSDNDFTGVPAEIGQLSDLRVLDLSGNSITGLPYEIGNLQQLERLDLSNTNYAHVDLAIIRDKLPPSTVIVTD